VSDGFGVSCGAGERQQTTESRQQTADNSKQQTANSRQQTANSRQQTAGSRQQTADSRQQTVCATDQAAEDCMLAAFGRISSHIPDENHNVNIGRNLFDDEIVKEGQD
jgi:sRNA-binding protein